MKTNKEHEPYLEHIEYRCALVADAVYGNKDLNDCGLPLATSEQNDEIFTEESEGLRELRHNNSNGLYAQIYYDERSNRFILGFRGTEPLNIGDWLANGRQFFGHKAKHYQQGVQLVQHIRPDRLERVILTGHSLGGGVAPLAAVVQKIPSIVFNPPNIHVENLKKNMTEFNEDDILAIAKKIERFVVAGELLDIFNRVMKKPYWSLGVKRPLYGSFSIHRQVLGGWVGRKLLARLVPNPFVVLLTSVGLPLLEKSLELHLMPEVFIALRKYFSQDITSANGGS